MILLEKIYYVSPENLLAGFAPRELLEVISFAKAMRNPLVRGHQCEAQSEILLSGQD